MTNAVRSEEFIGRYADLQYGGGHFVADLDALQRAPELGQSDGACVASEFVSDLCWRDPAARRETIVENCGDGPTVAAQPVAPMLPGVAIVARPKLDVAGVVPPPQTDLLQPSQEGILATQTIGQVSANQTPTAVQLSNVARALVREEMAPAQGRQELS